MSACPPGIVLIFVTQTGNINTSKNHDGVMTI